MRMVVACLILLSLAPTAMSQDYGVDFKRKTIERVGAGGEGAIQLDKHLTKFLRFTASPKGWLMYIEDLDTTEGLSLGDAYVYYQGERRAAYLKHYGHPYDPERITKILHVTDPAGKDLYVVPIADKYGSFSSFTGRFLSDRLIEFDLTDRRGNISPVSIVNFIEGKVWTWLRLGDYRIDRTEASPDGSRFVVALTNDKTKERILYHDGALLLPYFDSEAPMASDSPEKYDQHIAKLVDKLKADYPGGFQFTMDREGMWSADGRFLAVVQVPSKARKGAAASADATATTTDTQEAAVLLVDTAKAGPGKDYRQYSTRLPITVPAEWKTAGDSPDQPPLLSTLTARFDSSQSAIELSSPRFGQGRKVNVPLPKNWNARE